MATGSDGPASAGGRNSSRIRPRPIQEACHPSVRSNSTSNQAGSLQPDTARAADEGLANVEFRSGDATRTGLPDGSFDAVVCVFGSFDAVVCVFGEVEPALFKAFNPWDEITTPAALAGLFARAGLPRPAVTSLRTDVVFGTAGRPE